MAAYIVFETGHTFGPSMLYPVYRSVLITQNNPHHKNSYSTVVPKQPPCIQQCSVLILHKARQCLRNLSNECTLCVEEPWMPMCIMSDAK